MMRITESTLRKIIREELDAAKAEKQILAGIGANAPLMIKRGIPAFAKKVAAGEMTVKQVVNKLRASIREAEGMDEAPMEESGHFDRTPEQKLKTALMAMNTKSPMDSESNANAIIAHNEESELYQDVLKNIAVHGAPSREDLQKLVDAHAKRNFDRDAQRQRYRR